MQGDKKYCFTHTKGTKNIVLLTLKGQIVYYLLTLKVQNFTRLKIG